MAALRRFFAMCCILAFEAVAILAPGSAYAFSGSLEAAGLTAVGNAVKYAGEARFVSGVAKTTAIARAAASSMAVEVALTRAASAGPAIAGACFAQILACGAIASIAVWMATGDFFADPETGEIERMKDRLGPCFKVTGAPWYTGACNGDPGSAIAAFVAAYDALNIGDSESKNSNTKTYSELLEGTATYTGTLEPNQSTDLYIVRRNVNHKLNTGEYWYTQDTTMGYTLWRMSDQLSRVASPTTAEEVEAWATTDAPAVSDDVANDAKTHGVAIPVDAPAVDDFVKSGDPYPCTTFPSGTCQDGTRVKTDPTTADPMDVTMEPRTADPTTIEDEDPGNDDEVPEKDDQCAKYPDTVGCTKIGEDPGDQVAKKTVTVSYAAEWLGLPAGCPPPMVVNGNQISYQSACDAMNQIRPFVVALAAVSAMLTALAIIRSSS